MELTKKQIERQDLVDNAIFTLLQEVNPTANELAWDIEMIGEVRDKLCTIFAQQCDDFSEQDFYPFLAE